MNSVESQYIKEIAGLATEKFLYNGIVPSVEQVELQIRELQSIYKKIGKAPMLGQVEGRFSPFKKEALEGIQDLINEPKIDLSVLRKVILQSYRDLLENQISWEKDFKYKESLLKSLNDRITFLLFKEENSAGFFESFIERFDNFSLINQVETDCFVNTDSGYVSLGFKSSQSPKLDISGSSLSIASIGLRGSSTLNLPIIPYSGSRLSSIVSYDGRGYIGVVQSNNPTDKLLITLNITLPSKQEINRLEVERIRRDYTAGTIECFVSSNEIDYLNVGTQTYAENAVFLFTSQEVKSINLLIKKDNYDSFSTESSNYEFFIDIKEVKAFKEINKYDTNKKALESIPHVSVNKFSKASLEVCDVTSDSTGIEYFLNGIQVTPINKEGVNPKVIEFNSSLVKTNLEGGLKISNELETNQVINSVTLSRFPFTDSKVWAINLNIEKENLKSVKVYKNWQPEASNEEIQPWKATPGFIESYVKIDNNWIHKKVRRRDATTVIAGAISEVELRRYDPLFPNNKKLLSEGYKYGMGYLGLKPYPEVREICEEVLVQTLNFEDLINGQGKMFYLTDYFEEYKPYTNILIMESPEEVTISSKTFYVVLEYTTEGIESVVLTAKFKSRDESISPLLLSYSIKVGN